MAIGNCVKTAAKQLSFLYFHNNRNVLFASYIFGVSRPNPLMLFFTETVLKNLSIYPCQCRLKVIEFFKIGGTYLSWRVTRISHGPHLRYVIMIFCKVPFFFFLTSKASSCIIVFHPDVVLQKDSNAYRTTQNLCAKLQKCFTLQDHNMPASSPQAPSHLKIKKHVLNSSLEHHRRRWHGSH